MIVRLAAALGILMVVASVTPVPAREAGGGCVDARETVLRSADIVVVRASADARDRLYACHLQADTRYSLRPTARRALFADGDWLAYTTTARRGAKARALNLRTGRSHSARAASGSDRGVAAVLVNKDGTLVWISTWRGVREVRAKSFRESRARVLDAGREIERGFLSLEDDRCTVSWRRGGEHRSARIACAGERH